MESNIATEQLATESKDDISVLGQLRTMMSQLTHESTVLKNFSTQLKNILKELEKSNKELEKLKNKKSRTKNTNKENSQSSGITKPVAISNDLADFLKVPHGELVPRNEVTKGVSEYVRKYELFDPTNKQKFLLDSKPEGKVLWKLLGEPTEGVTYFNLQRYLKNHYILGAPVEKVPSVVVPTVTTESVAPVSGDDSEKKKKKILVKKRKEPLAEEV